ncbi:hypothetical protein CYMTET_32074, partial [Cymbomonas tetramitiformis]
MAKIFEQDLFQGGRLNGGYVQSQLPSYDNLLAFIQDTDSPAFLGIDGRSPITHSELGSFVRETFQSLKTQHNLGHGSRIAILIPTGAELPVLLLACLAHFLCVPLNAASPPDEIRSSLRIVGAQAVLVQKGAYDKALSAIARELSIRLVEVVPSKFTAGLIKDDFSAKMESHEAATEQSQNLNGPKDVALVLFTSGTTGFKKLVPTLVEDVVVGVVCLAAAWGLTSQDRGCNFMPLHHVGGIFRNVLAPVFTGGSMVCMGSFDPNQFWDTIVAQSCTWYYGVPVMHKLIVKSALDRRVTSAQVAGIRMVVNSAETLLPSTARDLQQTFTQAAILPCYAMTECMPITSPPKGYALDRPGSVGQ